jgi:hypothetical protein
MSGPVIANVKRELRRRFSYGAGLDDSEAWTDELTVALTTYQERVAAEVRDGKRSGPAPRTDGRIDWATQVQLGLIEQAPPGKVGTLFTVQGTGVDMWTGPPADLARAVEADWEWQPIGNYPASPFPMWASIWQGITELRFQLRRHADLNPTGRIALAGFSQGAIVTSWVYKWDIALPGGILHDLLPRIAAGVTWGNPMAEQGKFHGNRYAGIPIPEGRGINRDRLENTPGWWLDFGHGRNSPQGQDIYCDTPLDPSGDMMTVICDIVMQQEQGRGFMGLVDQAGKLLADPEGRVPYLIDAVMQAGMFFIGGTGPHLSYDIRPAIDYLRGVAAGVRAGKVIAA